MATLDFAATSAPKRTKLKKAAAKKSTTKKAVAKKPAKKAVAKKVNRPTKVGRISAVASEIRELCAGVGNERRTAINAKLDELLDVARSK